MQKGRHQNERVYKTTKGTKTMKNATLCNNLQQTII